MVISHRSGSKKRGHLRAIAGEAPVGFLSETAARLHESPVISFFVKFQQCAVDPKAAPALRHPRLQEPQIITGLVSVAYHSL